MKKNFYIILLLLLFLSLTGCITVKKTDANGNVSYHTLGNSDPKPLKEKEITDRILNNSSMWNNSRTIHYIKDNKFLCIDELSGKRSMGHWWVKSLVRENGHRFGVLCLSEIYQKWNDSHSQLCWYLVPWGPEVVAAYDLYCFTDRDNDLECGKAFNWAGNYSFYPREEE